MKRVKAYIRGAYGPGNLGDDVLMVATLGVIKSRFSSSEIAIGVDHPIQASAFDPEVQWLPLKSPFSAELVVLGGGGQFFSFAGRAALNSTSLLCRLGQSVRAQSSILAGLMRLIMKARGAVDGLYFADNIGTFCIGLGPFQVDGKGKSRAERFLALASYVSVRDQTSADHCKELSGVRAEVFSDPSLLPELWYGSCPAPLKLADVEGGYHSFVLRDWPLDDAGAAAIGAMVTAARDLRNQGRKVRMVSLYRERDAHLIAEHADFEWLIWEPSTMTIREFMDRFCNESCVIVSARAHGVWLPAALGVPSIAIRIENKLEEVHNMLPNGTLLVRQPGPRAICDCIDEFHVGRLALEEGVAADVGENSEKVKRGVASLLAWVDSTGVRSR
ncbi:polysaccharide pyruvyl transferase family protein [Stenotrophomonas maltophilia]|nr:polysaccharide pyruvyl transferase family protein [Stenotrophomonas maltophilia]MBA0468477.1 polysaccharide pyruvyl transferase family protein [Stenotrophomonas maltophilia]MBA0475478.1 polysaccharide pyruvyl transferase family protein [Stenotrophomonas maltophilia]MBA0484798.1 polysaccharide pyruvyl transferase family protein [Stenotrophomonas maltophilia]